MDAAWWRAYRVRRGDELRVYNRLRRKGPKQRAQRRAQEQRRRARLRGHVFDPVPMHHPLLARAAVMVKGTVPGRTLQFVDELDTQDARSEWVLAHLEGRDPSAAAREFRATELRWRAMTMPLLEVVA